ncbi:alpha/beta hydrolase-fold protein, partial [Streptomyces yanii]
MPHELLHTGNGFLQLRYQAWDFAPPYGGSQFIDSPGTDCYHSYLCEEVVPYVDARYRTLPARDHQAIAGKSSGGLGATVTSMLRPDLFGAFTKEEDLNLLEILGVSA